MNNKALSKIFWGLLLSFFNITNFNLNIYMPFFGAILLVRGLLQIKNQNNYLKTAFIFSIIKLISQSIGIIFACSKINNNYSVNLFFSIILSIITVLLIYYLFAGFKNTATKLELYDEVRRTKNCFLLYFLSIVLMYLTLFLNEIIIITLPVIFIIYIAILVKTYKYNKAIGIESKYKLNKKYWLVFSCSSLVFIIICYTVLLGANAPKTNITTYNKEDAEVYGNVETIKDEMLKLGFDESILNDLPDSEILKYNGIKNVHKTEKTEESDGGKLHLISIVCQLEEKKTRFLEYYSWEENPKCNCTDLIGVSFSQQNSFTLDNLDFKCISLYDTIEYTYPITKKADCIEKSDFTDGIAAKFRVFGNNVTNQRGYITFEMSHNIPLKHSYNTVILYVHQSNILNIPYNDSFNFYRKNGASSNTDDSIFKRYVLPTTETYYGKNSTDK